MGISGFMIGKNEGAALRASGATTVSAVATFQEFITEANKDILAGFSSQGPTNVDFAVKPDLTSVGVNVLSSCVSTDPVDCGEQPWAFLSGTSMSTPHIAGSTNESLRKLTLELASNVKRLINGKTDGVPLANL